jgi:hypothetical protein
MIEGSLPQRGNQKVATHPAVALRRISGLCDQRGRKIERLMRPKIMQTVPPMPDPTKQAEVAMSAGT